MLATALMYLRPGVVVAIFNIPLALQLAGPLGVLALAAAALATLCLWLEKRNEGGRSVTAHQLRNPLELPPQP